MHDLPNHIAIAKEALGRIHPDWPGQDIATAVRQAMDALVRVFAADDLPESVRVGVFDCRAQTEKIADSLIACDLVYNRSLTPAFIPEGLPQEAKQEIAEITAHLRLIERERGDHIVTLHRIVASMIRVAEGISD